MKQQSIEELEKELNALSPKQAKETLDEAQSNDTEDINNIPLEHWLDFTRYPITGDERKQFELAVADYNRRRYALQGDPDPDDIHGFVTSKRTVRRMLYWLKQ